MDSYAGQVLGLTPQTSWFGDEMYQIEVAKQRKSMFGRNAEGVREAMCLRTPSALRLNECVLSDFRVLGGSI
jgi:hypothetical protein